MTDCYTNFVEEEGKDKSVELEEIKRFSYHALQPERKPSKSKRNHMIQ